MNLAIRRLRRKGGALLAVVLVASLASCSSGGDSENTSPASGGGNSAASSGVAPSPSEPDQSDTSTSSAGSGSGTSAGSSVTYDEEIHAMVPKEILEKGEIVDGVAPATPPKGYLDADGKYIGYEPEIAAELSKIIGVKITVPDFVTFDAIIPGIEAGRYDTSGFNDTLDREKTLDFVDLLYAGSGLIVPEGNPDGISETTLCGMKLGLQKGSTQIDTTVPELSAACENDGKKKIDLDVYPDNNAAMLALRSSRIDAVMTDTQVAAWLAKQTPGTELVPTKLVNGLWGYGFKKGSGLVPVFEAALQKMQDEGTLGKIFKAYDIESLALPKIMVNGANTVEK